MTLKTTRFPWKFVYLHHLWYFYYCHHFNFRLYAEVWFFRGGLLSPPLYTTNELKIYFEGYTTTVNKVTWTNGISLDSSILAHVEYMNGFPMRELFLDNNHVFCTWLTRRNGLKRVVFTSILCRKLDYYPKIILASENHLYIQHGQGLRNPTICHLSM